MKKIVILPKQSFCFGVSRAIDKLKDITSESKRVVLLGPIVHNALVNAELSSRGFTVVTGMKKIELIDQLNPERDIVVISAHGVSQKVVQKLSKLGFTVIDTTCPRVIKAKKEIFEAIGAGYQVVYFGRPNHPEVEALEDNKGITFIFNKEDILSKKEMLKNKKLLAFGAQTTVTESEFNEYSQLLKLINDDIVILPSICHVTSERQNQLRAALNIAIDNSLFVIIGDSRSQNSKELYHLALRSNHNALFVSIDNIDELLTTDFSSIDTIYISSGTSTSLKEVNAIVNILIKKGYQI